MSPPTPHPEKAPFPDGSFTPGPWTVVDERDMTGEFWICVTDPEGWQCSLAAVRNGSGEADDLGDEEANARLIAAAPDMFEALKHILAGALSLPRFAEEEARAALSKATGGQHV